MATQYSVATAIGRNGARYEFQVYPTGTQFRPLAGLYFFGFPKANGGWHALYIGQTHDLQVRVGAGLQNHHQFSAAIRLGLTHIGVHLFPGSEQERCWAEGDLINRLRPQLNGNGGQQQPAPRLRFI
jgi:hypothetical protein